MRETIGLTFPELYIEPGGSGQVRDQQGLGGKWGWADLPLGRYGTGMEMPDEVTAALKLPARDDLLYHKAGAFALREQLVKKMNEVRLATKRISPAGERARDMTIGDLIAVDMGHANRHLGMVEALRGVMGDRGTATR